ncbi:MAG: DUF6356 family protein [Pseudomonadota bacterium]
MRLFTEHPASVGETYGEHFRHASGFGFTMLIGGLACLVHAVFPFLCLTTGSDRIRALHDRMVVNRVKTDEPDGVVAEGAD